MSGWDNAPEYGGSEGLWTTVLSVIGGIVFSALIAWLVYSNAAAQSTAVTGVASVIDGDTIEIHGQRIRLSGYDSPERGSVCGGVNVYQRASLALSDHIGRRTVSCTLNGQDRYGRRIGRCSVGDADIGEYMVSQGWARDWPRHSGGAYSDEEAGARNSRRGIWGMTCPDDLWGSRNYVR